MPRARLAVTLPSSLPTGRVTRAHSDAADGRRRRPETTVRSHLEAGTVPGETA